MESAWSEQDYLDFHYSRMAMRALRKRSGIKTGRIGNADARAVQIVNELRYSTPEIEIKDQLLPVVISDNSNTPGR